MHAARFLVLPGLLMLATTVQAGMPSPLPTDVVQTLRLNESGVARLEAISFFLAVLVLVALILCGLWNSLRRDFPRWPRLSFGRALALVGLWGTGFLVVLTMIATAREMMTPGVWQKKELLYHVPQQPLAKPDPQRVEEKKP